MEYKKIVNWLDNTPNQPSKFIARRWVEVNDESRETNNISNEIKFKISRIKSNSCDYSDTYIRVKGSITVLQIMKRKH